MTRTRTLAAAATAAIAAGAPLAGVAFAGSEMTDSDDSGGAAGSSLTMGDVDNHSGSTDRDAHGDAVSTLATTTTLTGEAKGDAISALASSNGNDGQGTSSRSSIATLATTTTATGEAKGDAISAAAKAQRHSH